MSWWLYTIVACATEVALVYAVLVMRRTRAHVSTSLIASSNPTGTLQVHLPGFGGDGELQPYNILPTILQRGDLLAVHYEGHYGKTATAFNEDEVLDRVFQDIIWQLRLGSYDKVEFIGTSFGAKLAFKTAHYLLARGVPSKGILVDSPLRWRDLQVPQRILSPLLVTLPFIPLFNLALIVPFLECLVVKVTFPGPAEDNIDKDLSVEERGILDSSVKLAQQARLTFLRDQVKTILRPIPETVHELDRVWEHGDVVCIRSMNDNDVVRESAAKSWSELTQINPIKQLKLPNAKHAAYGENPSAYRKGFPAAWRYLDSK